MPATSNTTEFPELFTPAELKEIANIYRLTDQELEVLRLLCHGLGNSEIAFELNVCYPTIRSHLRSIYAKTAQRDRVGVLLSIIHRFRSSSWQVSSL